MIRCFSKASQRLDSLIFQQLQSWAGALRPCRVLLKPNWVLHQSDPAFPIQALVTDARVIEAAALACLELFPSAESILVADCPLQYADWPLLCRQSGLEPVIQRLSKRSGGKIEFRDLRKEVFQKTDSFLTAAQGPHGDPNGYQEIELGAASCLEPISNQSDRFAVNDYSSAVTRSNHGPQRHRYLISRTVLQADLFINLPKWKAHQKTGLTGALKNLVGINGDKVYLPHFRKGAPRWGGDEYPDQERWLYFAQTALREKFQKKNQAAFRALKSGWEWIKRWRGIETRYANPSDAPKKFYLAGGAWPGNDTLWRMVYDLNRVIQLADARGAFQEKPARHYFCIVDGLISGQGNGPLQPLPIETDWLIFGEDPFQVDAALAWFMGFHPDKIPILERRRQFNGADWGRFDWADLPAALDGETRRLQDWPLNFEFAPPPGWRSHIERD